MRVAVGLVGLYVLTRVVGVAVHVLTQHWWFQSVSAGSVYTTALRTEVLLFVLFGGLAGLLGGGAAYAVLRTTPLSPPDRPGDVHRWMQRHPRLGRRVILVLATLVPLVRVGSAAAGQWQTWQLWRHASPWGSVDPTFHRDVSYYVEVYPLHRMVASLTAHAVWWALVIAVLTALVHGSIRLFAGPRGVTRGIVVVLSALLVPYLLLHAVQLWLDRAATVVSQRSVVTGPSYTDLHAVLPAKVALAVVSVAVAALLALNTRRGRLRFVALPLAVMLVASVGLGTTWPALVMRLRERPSAASLDLPLIRHNIKATSDAFGLTGEITTVPAGRAAAGRSTTDRVAPGVQVRVLDPNRLSPTFNVKQQLQAYYRFKSTLDVDRYRLGSGATTTPATDVAVAVRELNAGKVALGSWANRHLVYTHGYGVVAAPTDSLSSRSDVPRFIDATTTHDRRLAVTQPDIYFGQSAMPWSIVGQPSGSRTHVEFDHPAREHAAGPSYTTYTGDGGVPMGSLFRRLVYATSLHSPNILFSGQVNRSSRILTVRDPAARVAAVAPWLTLDGDVYPAVVDGHVDWVVDGYTTSSTYPGSQSVDLHRATTSTLTAQGSNKAQPHRIVNYLHNSVKAVVDAYTGQVQLYEWDQSAHPDPLLRAWESVFPGLVQSQSSMPADLLAHVRYPQDLFDVQRLLLTRYHVRDAAGFYSGNDFWKVPFDPTVAATKQLNGGPLSAGTGGTPTLPSAYLSLPATDGGSSRFALTSPLVTLNRRNLAGFLTVDADPGPDYGRLTLLEFPAGGDAASPGEVQNDIESDTRISEALTLQRGGNSRVVLGNLLTIPTGGQMLYVEPVYTQAQGGDSFPILRHVVAIYGDGAPAFAPDLATALTAAVRSGDTGSVHRHRG